MVKHNKQQCNKFVDRRQEKINNKTTIIALRLQKNYDALTGPEEVLKQLVENGKTLQFEKLSEEQSN